MLASQTPMVLHAVKKPSRDTYPTGPKDSLETRTPGHLGHKTREVTETKEQNIHPTEINLGINTEKYNHPKLRRPNDSVTIPSAIERAIWHHKTTTIP